MSAAQPTPGPWGFSAEYSPGIGWQYVLTRDGALFGRYGSFETEAAALREGRAAIAKTAYQGVRCQCIVTGCRPGPGCPVYSKRHCEAHMAFVRSAKATGSAA